MNDISFGIIYIILGISLSFTFMFIGKIIIDGIHMGAITSWDVHLVKVGLCLVISILLVLRHLAKG